MKFLPCWKAVYGLGLMPTDHARIVRIKLRHHNPQPYRTRRVVIALVHVHLHFRELTQSMADYPSQNTNRYFHYLLIPGIRI